MLENDKTVRWEERDGSAGRGLESLTHRLACCDPTVNHMHLIF